MSSDADTAGQDVVATTRQSPPGPPPEPPSPPTSVPPSAGVSSPVAPPVTALPLTACITNPDEVKTFLHASDRRFTTRSVDNALAFVLAGPDAASPSDEALAVLLYAVEQDGDIGEQVAGTLLLFGGLSSLMDELGKLHGLSTRGAKSASSTESRPAASAAPSSSSVSPSSSRFSLPWRRRGLSSSSRRRSRGSSSTTGFTKGTGYSSASRDGMGGSDELTADQVRDHRDRSARRSRRTAIILDLMTALLRRVPTSADPPTAVSTVMTKSPLLPVIESFLRYTDGADVMGTSLGVVPAETLAMERSRARRTSRPSRSRAIYHEDRSDDDGGDTPAAAAAKASAADAQFQHTTLLQAMYRLVQTLAGLPMLTPLLLPLSDQPTSLHDLVKAQRELMSEFVAFEVVGAGGDASSSAPPYAASTAPSSVNPEPLLNAILACASAVDSAVDHHQVLQQIAAAEAAGGVTAGAGAGSAPPGSAGVDDGPGTTSPVVPSSTAAVGGPSGSSPTKPTAEYADILRKQRVGSRAMVDSSSSSSSSLSTGRHTYAREGGGSAGGGSSGCVRRVAREIRSMRTSLPVDFGSTVLVRHDKARPYYQQAIIFAPEDTPYDSGAFLFDMYCPPDYPKVPPKVSIVTTGGGRVRFNPNLYANGKVCLSLLGTWRGGTASEGWTASSTLTQVLVSIQSLIFVKFPYYNEPGVESQMGTAAGREGARYADNGGYEALRVATLRWAMVDALEHPPPSFEQAVQDHFRLKRTHIGSVVETWLQEAKTSRQSSHRPALLAAARQLFTLFDSKFGSTNKSDAETRVMKLQDSTAPPGSAGLGRRRRRHGSLDGLLGLDAPVPAASYTSPKPSGGSNPYATHHFKPMPKPKWHKSGVPPSSGPAGYGGYSSSAGSGYGGYSSGGYGYSGHGYGGYEEEADETGAGDAFYADDENDPDLLKVLALSLEDAAAPAMAPPSSSSASSCPAPAGAPTGAPTGTPAPGSSLAPAPFMHAESYGYDVEDDALAVALAESLALSSDHPSATVDPPNPKPVAGVGASARRHLTPSPILVPADDGGGPPAATGSVSATGPVSPAAPSPMSTELQTIVAMFDGVFDAADVAAAVAAAPSYQAAIATLLQRDK